MAVCPSWIQALITFDRFRSVVYPQKFNFIKSRFKLKCIFSSLFFIVMLINLSHLGYYTVITSSTKKLTFDSVLNQSINVTSDTLSCTSSYGLGLYTDIMVVLLRSYIPFGIMFSMNIVTTKKLVESKKHVVQNRSLKKEMHFTKTVIFMDLMFFILYTPWSIWYAVNRTSGSLPSLQSPLISAYLNFFQSIFFSMAFLNNCASFFLNITFNNLFRKEFLRLTPGSWRISQSTASRSNNNNNNNHNNNTNNFITNTFFVKTLTKNNNGTTINENNKNNV
jgi:hypothetical protein